MLERFSVDAAKERFKLLYENHYRAIVGYFMRRVDHTGSAPDLAEDVFLIAWGKLDEVPTADNELYWLYGVAKRVLANHRRKVTRRWRITSRIGSNDAASQPVLDQVILRANSEGVREALGNLRTRDQELIRLAYWEELPRAVIAEMSGCSRATVDVRLHRAIRRLGRALEHSPQFSGGELPLEAPEERPC